MQTLSPKKLGDLVNLYAQMAERPSRKGLRIILYPVGLVGAGKTTVVKPLSKKLGLARVSSDEVRKILKDHGYDYDHVFDIVFPVLKQLLREGFGVTIDADCVRRDRREVIRKTAEEFGTRVVYIHVNPPETFIINKLRAYPHSWLFRDADEAIENYMRRKPLHKDLNFDFAYTFDPSRKNLNEQIEGAAEKIRALVEEDVGVPGAR